MTAREIKTLQTTRAVLDLTEGYEPESKDVIERILKTIKGEWICTKEERWKNLENYIEDLFAMKNMRFIKAEIEDCSYEKFDGFFRIFLSVTDLIAGRRFPVWIQIPAETA